MCDGRAARLQQAHEQAERAAVLPCAPALQQKPRQKPRLHGGGSIAPGFERACERMCGTRPCRPMLPLYAACWGCACISASFAWGRRRICQEPVRLCCGDGRRRCWCKSASMPCCRSGQQGPGEHAKPVRKMDAAFAWLAPTPAGVGVGTQQRATITGLRRAPIDHRRRGQQKSSKKAGCASRKDGRVVECAGLEIRFTGLPVTRVRIPLFPPNLCTDPAHRRLPQWTSFLGCGYCRSLKLGASADGGKSARLRRGRRSFPLACPFEKGCDRRSM